MSEGADIAVVGPGIDGATVAAAPALRSADRLLRKDLAA